MAITLARNIAAEDTQRRLTSSSAALRRTYETLSSGLRINRASDDAAGLSISSSLSVDSRVYNQGVRNINDGVSALNVAEGALDQLSTITIRQRELATQAANGVLSSAQRSALNTEASSLTAEYNRIIRSASYNSRTLLDGSFSDGHVQEGYGANGGVNFSLDGGLGGTGIDGTFNAAVSFATFGSTISDLALADFNGDGNLDIASVQGGSPAITVQFGNGDGTFGARISLSGGVARLSLTTGDFNRDGYTDIAAGKGTAGGTNGQVYLSDGHGNFTTGGTFTGQNTTNGSGIRADYINSDSYLDIIEVDANSTTLRVSLGNGDGTFIAPVSYNTSGFAAGADDLITADLNGDNRKDAIVSSGSNVLVYLNTGGTFAAAISVFGISGTSSTSISLADLNGDTVSDLVVTESSRVDILFGNSNGTFKARVSYGGYSTSLTDSVIRDFNADGISDIIVSNSSNNNLEMLLGNGNGTFSMGTSIAVGATSNAIAVSDLDGDTFADIVAGNNAAVRVLSAATILTDLASELDLSSQSGAQTAMTTLVDRLNAIDKQIGAVGAIQSRLSVSQNTLVVARENFDVARSRITDVDVADSTAELVRQNILQQSGLAVLGQANQLPALALKILTDSSV